MKGIMELEKNLEIMAAYDFFGVLKKSEASCKANAQTLTFSGVNRYGMVDVVHMFNKAADKGSAEEDLNAVIESLSNILIAAVLKHAGEDDEKKVSPDNWMQGFNAMAALFFSSYSVEELDYNEKKVGQEVVEKVIKIGFDVNGQPSGNLKTAIEKYLQKQGELMDELSFDGKYSDPYTLMGFVNFVKDDVHTCSLRAYFTDFDTNTVKIKQSCKDDKKAFDFNFKITHCNADFMLSNWETSAEFRERVKKFIDEHIPQEDYFDSLKTSHKFTVV